MEGPHPGGTSFLIKVASTPGNPFWHEIHGSEEVARNVANFAKRSFLLSTGQWQRRIPGYNRRMKCILTLKLTLTQDEKFRGPHAVHLPQFGHRWFSLIIS
ncbi:hypothetical protein M8J76_013990 [Diaphorina citri]|nr:hypothetical protein M8J75_008752 [Diaphorina citri]KAI5723996.1 hypothetical protein M8J76_013990 [Diaphorina citri]